MENRKAKCSGYGMFTGIFWVIALGIILGVVLGVPLKAGDGWDSSELAALLATGIGLAYILLSVVGWFRFGLWRPIRYRTPWICRTARWRPNNWPR